MIRILRISVLWLKTPETLGPRLVKQTSTPRFDGARTLDSKTLDSWTLDSWTLESQLGHKIRFLDFGFLDI